MPDKIKQQAEELLKSPEGRAFLQMIQASEGGRYNVAFGNKTFNSYSQHPNISTRFQTLEKDGNGNYKTDVSTAAGAYQILKPTWDAVAKKYGLKDFSPDSQDRAALYLALEKPGMYDAIKTGDVRKMVGLVNNIWTSLPDSTVGVTKHALRSYDFINQSYNAARVENGLKPLPGLKPVQPSQQMATGDVDIFGSKTWYGVGMNPTDSFLNRSLSRIHNQSWSDPGDVPFQVMRDDIGNKTVFGSVDLTQEGAVESLVGKLFNTDPNVHYGLSFYDGGLRPTVSRRMPDGSVVNMVESQSGKLFNAATGEQMNSDGTVYEGTPVEFLKPDYVSYSPDAPLVEATPENLQAIQNAQQNYNVHNAANMLEPDTDLLAQPQANTTGGAMMQDDKAPLISSTTASPVVQQVSPSEQVAKALGGDSTIQALNQSRPLPDLLRELVQIA